MADKKNAHGRHTSDRSQSEGSRQPGPDPLRKAKPDGADGEVRKANPAGRPAAVARDRPDGVALSADELAEIDVEDVIADEQATPQDRGNSRSR